MSASQLPIVNHRNFFDDDQSFFDLTKRIEKNEFFKEKYLSVI